jgi:hydroxyquinol 1,2-dioxygenase
LSETRTSLDSDGPQLTFDSDAVFGMKESLAAQFDRHPPGADPHGERMETPFYTVHYDFRLRPDSAIL